MYEKDDYGLPVQDIGTALRAINQNPTEAEVKDMINEANVNGKDLAVVFALLCLAFDILTMTSH